MSSQQPDIYKTHKASHILQDKAGTGKIAAEKIMSAQNLLDNNVIDFKKNADICITELEGVFPLHRKYHNKSPDYIKMLTLPLLSLKGMAGMCGYPVISNMSDTLIKTIEKVRNVDHDYLEICRSFILSVRFLTTNAPSTARETYESALSAELGKACERYTAKHNIEKS